MPQLEQISTYLSQIFWMVLTFGVLYFIMWKSALPRITIVLQERQEHIENDLQKAESVKQEAEAVLAAYEASVAKTPNTSYRRSQERGAATNPRAERFVRRT